jgi:hypothetical protein
MTEKTGPTHQPRRVASVGSPEEQRLRAEVEALRNVNLHLKAQMELRRQANRKLANRDDPLTEGEAQVFALQVEITNRRADVGHEQRHAKVVRRREKGTLTEAWDGSWTAAKGRWQEEG